MQRSKMLLISFTLLINLAFHFNPVNANPSLDLEISTKDSTNSTYPIYSKGTLFPEWNAIDQAGSSCNGPNSAVEFTDVNERTFSIKNVGEGAVKIGQKGIKAENKEIVGTKIDLETPFVLQPGASKSFKVTYDCHNDVILKKDLNGWTYITVSFTSDGDPISFNYLKVCTVENRSKVDYSIYIVLGIAVIIVATMTRQKKTLLGEQSENVDEIKPMHAVFFIVFASISLLTLYFFSEYIKGILSLVFVLYALTGCTVIFTTWTEDYASRDAFWSKHYQLPWIGSVNFHNIVCFLIAAVIVVIWFITRNWIFNNIIGLCIVCLIFRVVKLPSLKVAYLLLGMAFFYDIFWVFISTPIFGKSVMVVAATALDLPIKIEWPYMGETPLPRCSILGLGDMVLPGFFATFNYKFGLYKKTNAYYISTVISYALGMIACGAVLVITKAGQPALLYIVPSMLGAATLVSLKRGEFKDMWEGIPENKQYKDLEEDDKDDKDDKDKSSSVNIEMS